MRHEALINPIAIDYILRHSVHESDILARLREETAAHPQARFQIPPEQGQLLQLLIKLLGAQRTIEVGVFTGYSSLAVAMALPENGQIVACDVSEEYTAVAKRYWAEAGVRNKIDLRLGPAAASLAQLIEQGEKGRFDFAFIDADKTGYATYYEQCLQLVRKGGLIALDNMLQSLRVTDESAQDELTVAIRNLNEFIYRDQRVDALLLPFSDGLTLAVKR